MTSILTVLKYLMIMTRKFFFFMYGWWSSFDVSNSASQLSDTSNIERIRHRQHRIVSWFDREPSSFSTSIAALPSARGLQKSKSQTTSWPIQRLGLWEKRSILEDLPCHVALLDLAREKDPDIHSVDDWWNKYSQSICTSYSSRYRKVTREDIVPRRG